MDLEDRFVGCLCGLLVGDALGSHFEGLSPSWIAARYASADELLDRPPDPPWYYTDDTQMAIGVAEALLDDHEITESTLCARFVANYVPERGYGRGTRVVMEAIQRGADHRAVVSSTFPGGSFGNGAAMRMAPIGLFFHQDLDRVWQQARLSSLPTHVHPLGIEGARLIATAVAMCVRQTEWNPEAFFGELRRRCQTPEFASRLDKATGIQDMEQLSRLGTGIAAHESVVTALVCFALSPASFEQVVARAILLGGDTDTIAAMAGAVCGAHLGVAAIPQPMLDCVEDDEKGRSYVAQLARKLAAAC